MMELKISIHIQGSLKSVATPRVKKNMKSTNPKWATIIRISRENARAVISTFANKDAEMNDGQYDTTRDGHPVLRFNRKIRVVFSLFNIRAVSPVFCGCPVPVEPGTGCPSLDTTNLRAILDNCLVFAGWRRDDAADDQEGWLDSFQYVCKMRNKLIAHNNSQRFRKTEYNSRLVAFNSNLLIIKINFPIKFDLN